jgi:hypothetical protein
MNCCNDDCDVIQIIEPRQDLLVDTAGASSDMDERGEVTLSAGQTNVTVTFEVRKLSADYHFEYLYVDAVGVSHPGAVSVIPSVKTIEGFSVVFAGAPIGAGYVLNWRVVIVQTTTLLQVDAPEDLYLRMPRTSTMAVTFLNPRSSTGYGFSELRVENLVDAPASQALIHVQVYAKTLSGCSLAVNPRPPSDNYFLRVRTP